VKTYVFCALWVFAYTALGAGWNIKASSRLRSLEVARCCNCCGSKDFHFYCEPSCHIGRLKKDIKGAIVIVKSGFDHNGALATRYINPLKDQYLLFFVDSITDTSLITQAVEDVHDQISLPIKALIIVAHGKRDSVDFGRGSVEDALGPVMSLLDPNAHIILVSCASAAHESYGVDIPLAGNLAQRIAFLTQKGQKVYGASNLVVADARMSIDAQTLIPKFSVLWGESKCYQKSTNEDIISCQD
jgi:hypothetical protein